MKITGSSSLVNSLRDARAERERYSKLLASGGNEATWSSKTSAQIDVSITKGNKIQRLEGHERDNNLIESRLRTQLLALDDFMKLARKIHEDFMPGNYTMGGVRPGLAAAQEATKKSFHDIGNMVDSVSGEYAMGGVATQTAPIKNVMAFGIYTGAPSDYSTAVSGSISVYINDDGITTSLSGNDFDLAIGSLYRAIMQLSTSITGADVASDQASVFAASAQKILLSKYYEKLSEIEEVEGQSEELSNSIQQAITLKEEMTEESMEGLLAKVMSSGVMEEIRQHLLTQQNRKAQDAAEMLRRG